MKSKWQTVLVAGFCAMVIRLNVCGADEVATLTGDSTDVLKGLKAPVSAESPWRPPDMAGFPSVLKVRPDQEVDAQRDYELAELIDLAERANPTTKAAWEQAKQAASAVGLARSEYFPLLALRASGDYAREQAPLPLTPTKGGFEDVKAQEAEPVADLEWVLLDFGSGSLTFRLRPILVLMHGIKKSCSRCRVLSTNYPRSVGGLKSRNHPWPRL